jgi:hypothetical protein
MAERSKRGDGTDVKPNREAQIRAWLRDHGYPFELEVGADLAETGWIVRHAQAYLDSETGKPREIDIVANIAAINEVPRETPEETQPSGFVRVDITLVIECKGKGKHDKSWLTFHSPHDPYSHWFIHRSPKGVADAIAAYSPALGKATAKLYDLEVGNVAHGATVAFLDEKTPGRGGGDPDRVGVAYSAMQSAIAAATALADRDAKEALLPPNAFHFLRIILPVVVVESDIFACRLAGNGELLLEKRDWVCLRATTRAAEDWPTAVLLVQGKSLKSFATALKTRGETIGDELLPHVAGIVAHFEKAGGMVQRTVSIPE